MQLYDFVVRVSFFTIIIVTAIYFYSHITFIRSYDLALPYAFKKQLSAKNSKVFTTLGIESNIPLISEPSMKKRVTIKSDKLSESYSKTTQTKCGLILFLHINQCAGGSLGRWFRMRASGYHLLEDKNSWKIINATQVLFSWKSMLVRASSFVKKVSNKAGWKVMEIHHGFPGIYYMKENIQRWKEIIERKGCVFYKTTMLRDPLERFISNVNKNKPSIDNIDNFIESRKNWLSRYFLFGICGYFKNQLGCGFDPKGSFTSTPFLNKTFANEATKIMGEFDLVGFTDRFLDYVTNIRTITGWKQGAVNTDKMHKTSQNFNLTQEIVKKFLEKNQEDYLLYYSMKHEISSKYYLNS